MPLRCMRHRLPCVLQEAENGLTTTAREWLQALAVELQALDQRITTTDQQIERVFEEHEACQRLAQLAGIGPLTATALVPPWVMPPASRMGASSRRGWDSSPVSIPREGKQPCSGSPKAGIGISACSSSMAPAPSCPWWLVKPTPGVDGCKECKCGGA